MKLTAFAKINLNLHVTGRRDDGYHLLESDVVFTQWGDDITLTPSDHLSLTASGSYASVFTQDLLSTDRGAPNLIVKAIYMMADRAKIDPKFDVHITKNIPAGAGLGGGSSDAAAVMKGLNDLWDMNLPMAELCAMGMMLGADVPVCLHAPHPCRFTGIGESVEPLKNMTASKQMVIAWPATSLSTQNVFRAHHGEKHPHNDLTDAAISLCSDIGDLITRLDACEGCEYASMSGSGSACFGIFKTKDKAAMAAKQFDNAVATSII